MAWIKSLLPTVTFAGVISLQLCNAPSFSSQKEKQYQQPSPDQKTRDWEVSQTFQPPDRGAPAATGGASSRSGSCVAAGEKKLTALIPASNLGLTLTEHPTFFGYVPKSRGLGAEFILMDRNNRTVYRKRFPLPDRSGIVRISHPTSERPLEIGKAYKWTLVIVCDDVNRSGNPISSGWIERIQPNPTLANKIKNAPPETLPTVYANAGIWHEALANLIELRRQQPTNAKLADDWKKLLNSDSVKLGAFAQEPLLDCCQVR